MFIERGFDAVRVADVAEACGVSEKTASNRFPTKESLLLDRWDATMVSLRTRLAEPGVPPVEATLRVLADELGAMTASTEAQDDPTGAAADVGRFGAPIQTTPSPRAHQGDMVDQLVAVAAEVLAERAGMAADDPELQIAATALLGLWQVHFRSLRKHAGGTHTPAQVREAVTADVLRAARLLDAGLSTFTAGSGAAWITTDPVVRIRHGDRSRSECWARQATLNVRTGHAP